MRVLYVLRYWPTLSETFVSNEIAELRRRGHSVTVFALGERVDGQGLDPVPGVEVWRNPRGWQRLWTAPSALASGAPHPPDGDWRLKDRAALAWLVRRMARHGFDRIHAHFAGEASEWARALARASGLPYSVTVHANGLFRPRPLLQRVLSDAQTVVAVCEHHRQWIRERYGVRSTVVHCGVDPDCFSPIPRPTGDSGDPFRFITVARWVPKKGLDTLMAAVESLQAPMSVRVVSEPPSPVTSPRVITGALPNEAVPAALQASDCFVLPSRVDPDGDRDGVPVALMEAMACGLPVIATSVSGIGELVDDEVGWLIPPDSPDALASAMRAAMACREVCASKGARARQRVLQAWTLSQQVDGLCRAWGTA